jgi:KaiC/GvpD/RAD55 family RecA-like ATPase
VAAQALRSGHKALYHAFQHPPSDVDHDLTKFGLDIAKFQRDGVFRILDSFSVQTGGLSPISLNDPIARSLKIPDLSISSAQEIKKEREEGIPEEDQRWIHIDDNTAIITRYNPENAVLDFWRTRHFPFTRLTQEVTFFSMLAGTVTEPFLSQVETIVDAIIDFKTEEKEGEVGQLVRIRRMRGKRFNSRWQRLNVSVTGEVTVT